MKPTRFLSLLVPPLLAMLLAGCASHSPALDGFTVGFSTPSGNRIWVREAIFDGSWDIPVGNLACCWEEAGPLYGIGPGPMPSSVRLRWDDESRGVIYQAQTELPPDLTHRALELPPTTRHANGEVRRDRFLIIGLKDDGSMIIWLSNSEHPNGIDGYALETVAKADGRIVREMRPEERRPVGD